MTRSYLKYKTEKWVNLKEKLDYLKNSVDVKYLLISLGITPSHESSKEIRCECPIHGGDNKTAFRFNKETRTWVCFTNKCHEVYGNDILGLIKAITKKDFMESFKYLKSLTGDIDNVDYSEMKRKREIDDFISSYDKILVVPKAVNNDSLNKFKSLRSNFFIKQGFKESTLDHFEIAGGWTDKHGIIRDIIPIRNDRNELVAYSLRDIRSNLEDDTFKYILTPGFNKDNCLYNLNNAQKYSNDFPIIVVEGFKSVWRLYEYGIKNVVATMGAGITEGQQYLLQLYAFKGAVVMFDNDKAGVGGIIKACSDLSNKIEVLPVFIQEIDEDGKGLDPADLTQEQIYEYLNTYF